MVPNVSLKINTPRDSITCVSSTYCLGRSCLSPGSFFFERSLEAKVVFHSIEPTDVMGYHPTHGTSPVISGFQTHWLAPLLNPLNRLKK